MHTLENPRFAHELFNMGHIVATPGAIDAFSPLALAIMIAAHGSGCFGDLDAEDTARNRHAVASGEGRIISVYKNLTTAKGAATLWIITESDRSVTTCLLPDEY